MDGLIAFLRARLDEDAYYAERAGGHEFTFDSLGQVLVSNGATISKVADLGVQVSGWHIARHDPARVLREVAAKREILRRHAPDGSDPANCLWCSEYDRPYCWPCPDVLSLTAVYSDHPDYRAEWKP